MKEKMTEALKKKEKCHNFHFFVLSLSLSSKTNEELITFYLTKLNIGNKNNKIHSQQIRYYKNR